LNYITYIYAGGRSKKYLHEESFAGDFFYGYMQFKKLFNNVNYVELTEDETGVLDKFLIKVLKIPIYLMKSLKSTGRKNIFESKNLIFINESSLFSFFPLYFFYKKKHKGKVHYFPMGLVETYLNAHKFSKYYIKWVLSHVDNILFIGKGELEAYINNVGFQTEKCNYVPFAIDSQFWRQKKFKSKEIKNLLFVGNDRNRDYELLNNLCKDAKNYKITVITNNNNFKHGSLSTVNHLSGHWRLNYLSDKDMLNEYSKADLVLIPLKDSFQPSGQSVALQSLSVGTPVMMTQNKGFWDRELFQDMQNIIFQNSDNSKDWLEAIDSISDNETLLDLIATNGRKVIDQNHNLDNFVKILSSYLI